MRQKAEQKCFDRLIVPSSQREVENSFLVLCESIKRQFMDQIVTCLVAKNQDRIPVEIIKKIQMTTLPKEDLKRQI